MKAGEGRGAGETPQWISRLVFPILGVLAGCFAVLGAAHGAEYTLGASLAGTVEYNDNLSLRLDENPGWRYTVTPGLNFSRITEANEISATASVGFNYYSRDDLEERNDRALGIRALQRFERSEIGLNARYSRETTAQGQIALNGVNLGTQFTDRWSISPYWTYSLSEKVTLLASAEYLESSYDREPDVSDETTKSVSFGFSYAVSPRGDLGLSVERFEFDTSPRTSKSDSFSVRVNGSYRVSERLSLSGSLGVQRTESEQGQDIFVCPVDPALCQLGLVAPVLVAAQGEATSTNYPFDFALNWAMSEKETVSVTASNSVGQFGSGATTVYTSVAASYARTVSERLNVGIGAIWSQSRTLDRSDYGNYFSISPTVSYKLTERWSAGAGYRYARASYPDIDGDIDANSVFATISYNWPVWRRSSK